MDIVSRRRFQLHGIEQRLVIVHGAIINRLDGAGGVASPLAVVIHLRASNGCTGVIGERPIAEVAGQADFDPVRILEQRGSVRTKVMDVHVICCATPDFLEPKETPPIPTW